MRRRSPDFQAPSVVTHLQRPLAFAETPDLVYVVMDRSRGAPAEGLGEFLHAPSPPFSAIAARLADLSRLRPKRPARARVDPGRRVFQSRWEPGSPPLARFASDRP